MSEIWIFSPSVQCELQKCLAAAAPDESNKWIKQFGKPNVVRTHNLTNFNDENNLISDKNVTGKPTPIVLSDDEDHKQEDKENCDSKIDNDCEYIEKLCEFFDSELSTRFDNFIEECSKNPIITQKLANRLSTTTIAKLFKYIYDNNVNDLNFIKIVFKYFFPTYLKREYNCLALDLLVRGSKLYPIEFELLVKEIAKDLEAPNKILQDYVKTLTETQQTKFLLILEPLDLTSEEFVHNLFSIYTAYKSCTKLDNIHNFISYLLYEHSNSCALDKNYGRLLLAFLQTMKSGKRNTKLENVEKIIASHRSPFKRPCLTIFNELKGGGQINADFDTDSD